MIIGALNKPFGEGKIKVFVGNFSITGTGTISTGLKEIIGPVQVTVQNAETTIPTHTASVSNISGGNVDVVVITHDSSANAISSTSKTVGILAFGW